MEIMLSGNHFEIGRNLGKFWGDYFSRMDKRDKRNNDHFNNYKEWLTNDKTRKRNIGLLKNMGKHFPALLHELIGMNIGINESKKLGFRSSLYGLFTCWLAESDIISFSEYNGCSSAIFPTKNGFPLAHSDEYEEQFPLLVADISLKKARKTIRFISISHPFQLLGSAAGMTTRFAFQGNSIGCSKDKFEKLRETWPERIPKTVFTRMMLEMASINEIKSLYRNYSSTLPNHHYVVFRDKAYSIEIRPSDSKELRVKELRGKGLHIHTNHFLNDDSGLWVFTDEEESVNRFNSLNQKMEQVESSKQVRNKFLEFLNGYPGLKNRTSGAFFFTIQKGRPLLCEGELSYDSTPFSISVNRNSIQ